MSHRFTGLSRNTFLLAFASFFADISTEMLYPVLPVFLTQILGASGTIVGLVDGFAQATQNIVQGFSGALSDRLQRRKPVALIGYFLAALGKPLMGLSTVWQGVFGARLLDRLGSGIRSSPRDALIASSWTNGIAAALSDLRVWATMRAPSSDRCSPCFFSIQSALTFAQFFMSRLFLACWPF